jgi:hypothetical protein
MSGFAPLSPTGSANDIEFADAMGARSEIADAPPAATSASTTAPRTTRVTSKGEDYVGRRD